MGTPRLATASRDAVGHHRHRSRRHDPVVQPVCRDLLRSSRLRADRARLRRLRRGSRTRRARRRDLRGAPGRAHVAGGVRDQAEGRCDRLRPRRRLPAPRRSGAPGRCGVDVARPVGSKAGREPAPCPVRDRPHARRSALDRGGESEAPPNGVRGARLGHGRAVGARRRTIGSALPGHVARSRKQRGRIRRPQRAHDLPEGHGAPRARLGRGGTGVDPRCHRGSQLHALTRGRRGRLARRVRRPHPARARRARRDRVLRCREPRARRRDARHDGRRRRADRSVHRTH